SESGHFNYSIEKWLVQDTSSEQMVVDSETIKENCPKIPIELDSYKPQNKSEKENSTLKEIETTCFKIQDLPKLLTIHKNENLNINLTLIEIDSSKFTIGINIETNAIEEEKILAPRKQFLDWCYRNALLNKCNQTTEGKREQQPIKNPVNRLKKRAKIEMKNDEAYSKASSLQKVPQINAKTIHQSGAWLTYAPNSTLVEVKKHGK
ncbi:19988_t:CDS:2, partial [Gigaspora margarita]